MRLVRVADRFNVIPLVGNLSPWQTSGFAHGPRVSLTKDGTTESLAAPWPSRMPISGWDGTHTSAGHHAGTKPMSLGVTRQVRIGIMSLSQERELV